MRQVMRKMDIDGNASITNSNRKKDKIVKKGSMKE